jgi:hypothetical protein
VGDELGSCLVKPLMIADKSGFTELCHVNDLGYLHWKLLMPTDNLL